MQNTFDIIIAAGGTSMRCGTDKLSYGIGGATVLSKCVDCFKGIEGIKNIIVTRTDCDLPPCVHVSGGQTRGQSVKNALAKVSSKYVLVHDGARPFVSKDLIKKVMENTVKFGASAPFIPVTDTLVIVDGQAVDRSQFRSVQTPQGFTSEILRACFEKAEEDFTDEATLYKVLGNEVFYFDGEAANKKITYAEELYALNNRVGIGFDAHRFTENKKLFLGGVCIPHKFGLLAHSDGDVVLHAVIDALLSSAHLKDIGTQFPDTDNKYKDIDSKILLAKVAEMLKERNVKIQNIAVTVMCQTPRLAPHIEKMQLKIAEVLEISENAVTINATTTENLGITAKDVGIACLAVANVL